MSSWPFQISYSVTHTLVVTNLLALKLVKQKIIEKFEMNGVHWSGSKIEQLEADLLNDLEEIKSINTN